jgi:hypothetical protein
MILELQANRIVLDELLTGYSMFLFTGGPVPRGRWPLVAITSYLEHPFAAERISTRNLRRYRDLAEEIVALGDGATTAGPRTLRHRRDIVAPFIAACSEIRALGNALEPVVTSVLQELQASSLQNPLSCPPADPGRVPHDLGGEG